MSKRVAPTAPPRTVPDSWEDSDDDDQGQQQPISALVSCSANECRRLPPPPPAPVRKVAPIVLLKRSPNNPAVSAALETPALSSSALLMMDSNERQGHYEKTRQKIFASQSKALAAPMNQSKSPAPALRSRELPCEYDPDFVRDVSLYTRRFDPGFGLADDGVSQVRPEKTYESEFPDALARR